MHLRQNRQKGMTLVMVALLMVVFMGIAAIAIDAGMLYTARTAAQHAVDAAALSGVYEFINPCASSTPPSSCTGWDLATAAENSALTMAAQNSIFGKPVAITTKFAASPCTGSATESWVCVDEPNRSVTAYVAQDGGLGILSFFARVIGSSQMAVSAMGTAQAGQANEDAPTATSSYCLKPVFLPNTILAPTGMTAANACQPTATPYGPAVIFNSDGTLSAWAAANKNTLFGNPYLIRPTSPSDIKNGGLLNPGQFFSLNFADSGGGAQTYSCTLGKCINECPGTDPNLLNCGMTNSVSLIDIETGNMVGPTVQGINTLIGNPPGDTYGNYVSRLGEGPTTSVNLAAAPVWDVCSQLGTIKGGTKNNMKVLGFVKVFVDRVVQPGAGSGQPGDVTAHVLEPIACGQVTADTPPPAPPPGPYGVPIRLVQNPANAAQ